MRLCTAISIRQSTAHQALLLTEVTTLLDAALESSYELERQNKSMAEEMARLTTRVKHLETRSQVPASSGESYSQKIEEMEARTAALEKELAVVSHSRDAAARRAKAETAALRRELEACLRERNTCVTCRAARAYRCASV